MVLNITSPIVLYVTEEVARQGHDVTQLDGIRRTWWMLEAWDLALSRRETGQRSPTVADAEDLGKLVERRETLQGLSALVEDLQAARDTLGVSDEDAQEVR